MKDSKLKKLKMPPKAEISMAELDMGPEEDMMGEEMVAEEGAPKEEMGPENDMLADISDDDLLAEIKKRGLMGQLSEEAPEEKARDKAMGAEEMEPEEEEYMA